MMDYVLCAIAQRARDNRMRYTDSPRWVEITYEELIASVRPPLVNVLEEADV